MRVASIDIGSYSVRLTIADIEQNNLSIVFEKGFITSLAYKLRENGYISEDRINETIDVLKEYKHIMENLGVEKVVAVATEALRRAKNRDYFINKVFNEVGIKVEIIDSFEEGRYSYIAAVFSLNLKGSTLVIDQGGGSTEFIYGNDLNVETVKSLKMGIVSLTEEFIKHDPPLREEIENMYKFIYEQIKGISKDVENIVGLGGTITTLAALEYDVYPYDPRKINGLTLNKTSIVKWFEYLSSIPLNERKKIPQIEDKRVEVIISGILMFICVLDYMNVNEIKVSDWGLKQGIIIDKFVLKKKK